MILSRGASECHSRTRFIAAPVFAPCGIGFQGVSSHCCRNSEALARRSLRERFLSDWFAFLVIFAARRLGFFPRLLASLHFLRLPLGSGCCFASFGCNPHSSSPGLRRWGFFAPFPLRLGPVTGLGRPGSRRASSKQSSPPGLDSVMASLQLGQQISFFRALWKHFFRQFPQNAWPHYVSVRTSGEAHWGINLTRAMPGLARTRQQSLQKYWTVVAGVSGT